MKESWFQMKPTALATSFFFLLAWVLVVALAARPIATYNEVNSVIRQDEMTVLNKKYRFGILV